MKILEIKEVTCFSVTTDEELYCQYYRYGADAWYLTMGESDEPVYNCEEIERLYQEYIK